MAKKLNELAVIDPKKVQIVPNADDLEAIREELSDMDRFPYGRVQIAPAGAGVLLVTEPGEEEPSPATEVQGVVLFSHRANGLWPDEFGKGGNAPPVCSSLNGKEGHNTATGELIQCAACPFNAFGSAAEGRGRGKACKNMRRLYIMRPGDMFPMLMTLPPSALTTYDKYRTKVMLGKTQVHAVMTKITLRTAQNRDGISYSAPVFEAVGLLPPKEAARVKQYADSFSGTAQRFGVTGDDYIATEQTGVYLKQTDVQQVDDGFEPIDDDELPFTPPLKRR